MRIALFFLFCLPMSLMAEKVVLHRGIMTAEGAFTLPIEYDNNYHAKVSLSVLPKFGYFVMENFWVGGAVEARVKLVDTSPLSSTRPAVSWLIGSGVQYYIPTVKNFFPFVGFLFSVGMNDASLISLRWVLDFPVGVMWAINEHVGLNIGVPVRIHFSSRSIFSRLSIEPGIIGISAFF